MADPISIRDYADLALRKAYNKTAGRVSAQIHLLTTAPTSQLQKALAELDQEVQRLEDKEESIKPDNAVLLKVMEVMRGTFKTVAFLIDANSQAIQASGVAVAIPTVTAKVFLPLANHQVGIGHDPVSSIALAEYRNVLFSKGIPWKTE